MKEKALMFISLSLVVMGLAGCSRTVEDVEKWKEKGRIGKLRDALTDPKEEVRKTAAESLGTLKAENAVDALAACLNDPEDSVRLAAVEALIATGSPATITPLIAALKQDNATIRLKAATALGTLKAPAAIGPLAEALNENDEAVQLAACKSIGQIGNEAGSPPLADKLANAATSISIRLACIDALTQVGEPQAFKALMETLADGNAQIREATKTALIKTGAPTIPSIVDGLRSESNSVRSAAISLLDEMDAVPTNGNDLVWYQLARVSLDNNAKRDAEVIRLLADQGEPAVSNLLVAASQNVEKIRETACQALEWIGQPCVESAMNQANRTASETTKKWFEGRTKWCGAPSESLDLWGAVSAINPRFEIDAKKAAALEAKGAPAAVVLASPGFKATRAYIPYLIKLLDDSACAKAARKKLAAAGGKASLPLIAAIGSDNTAIAEAAADLIGDRNDSRAFQPLMQALQRRIETGETLSESPIYTALQKQGNADAEPLLLKIRPNAERAIRVFSKQFPTVKPIGAETRDPYIDNAAPITFRIGYIDHGKPGSLEVTFQKDDKGDWLPDPALPQKPPQPK